MRPHLATNSKHQKVHQQSQSHLLYIQPDMKTEFRVHLECDFEYESDIVGGLNHKHLPYVNFFPNFDKIDTDDQIDCVLDKLGSKIFNQVDCLCGENYDRVNLGTLYFRILR